MILYATKETVKKYGIPMLEKFEDKKIRETLIAVRENEEGKEIFEWGMKVFYFDRRKCLQLVNFSSKFTTSDSWEICRPAPLQKSHSTLSRLFQNNSFTLSTNSLDSLSLSIIFTNSLFSSGTSLFSDTLDCSLVIYPTFLPSAVDIINI